MAPPESGPRRAPGDRHPKRSGARVVVANLPNILETAYFMRASIPSQATCNNNYQTYVACVFEAVLQVPPSTAAALTTTLANTYHLTTPTPCEPTSTTKACGYLTLQGTFFVIQYYNKTRKLPDLDNGKPGSGLGTHYITPEFAAKVQHLNDAVNTGIDAAARQTSTPLVDVTSIFTGVASGNKWNPYFQLAINISPGTRAHAWLRRRFAKFRRDSSVEHGLRAGCLRLHRHSSTVRTTPASRKSMSRRRTMNAALKRGLQPPGPVRPAVRTKPRRLQRWPPRS